MPLYEYRCERCGDMFEVIQKFSDQPLTTHEACGGNVERVLSAPALQFKGSGWYVTDYGRMKGNGSSSESKAKSEDGAKKSDESAGKTTKSESKPAATANTSPSSDKK